MQVLKKVRTPQNANPVPTGNSKELASVEPAVASAIKKIEHEFASYCDNSSPSYSADQVGYSGGSNLRYGNMSLETIRLRTIPKRKEDRIKRAYLWCEDDDYLSALVGIKTDFSIMGFDMRIRPEEGTQVASMLKETEKEPAPMEGRLDESERALLLERAEFQTFLSRLSRNLDFESITRDLLYDWHVSDSMILYWRVDPKVTNMVQAEDTTPPASEAYISGLLQVAALCPKHCTWYNADGSDILLYELPGDLYAKIKAVVNIRDPQQKAAGIYNLIHHESIPQSWIDTVAKGNNVIAMDRSNGDNWIVLTKGRKHWGLTDPTMATIFPYLEIRKAVKEGDFAAAYMVKHFIFHVTMGESIDAGPLAGQRSNWATPEETKKMFETVARTTKTARLVTNHTVKFVFVFPPEDMWSDAKYRKSEFAVSNWSGATLVVVAGEGTTNSSGYISTKRLVASIIYARRRVRHIWTQFFDHTSIKERLKTKIPKDMIVSAGFDEQVLKEPRQLLDELKFAVQSGFGDPYTSLKELGRDPDEMRTSKLISQADNRKTGVYQPLSQPVFFGGQGQGGGRPPNEGTQTDADTRNQPAVLK